jgi:hypothetical protein
LDAAVLYFVAVQVIDPKFQRGLGDGIRRGLNLTGTGAALHASIGKGGVNGTRVAIRVRIIQMVVSVSTIKEDRLLDHPLAEHLCLEVDVLLSTARTYRDVVYSLYKRHDVSPPPGV